MLRELVTCKVPWQKLKLKREHKNNLSAVSARKVHTAKEKGPCKQKHVRFKCLRGLLECVDRGAGGTGRSGRYSGGWEFRKGSIETSQRERILKDKPFASCASGVTGRVCCAAKRRDAKTCFRMAGGQHGMEVVYLKHHRLGLGSTAGGFSTPKGWLQNSFYLCCPKFRCRSLSTPHSQTQALWPVPFASWPALLTTYKRSGLDYSQPHKEELLGNPNDVKILWHTMCSINSLNWKSLLLLLKGNQPCVQYYTPWYFFESTI